MAITRTTSNPIKLYFVQGETVSFPITIQADGSPSVVDLTGVTITSSIRKEYHLPVVGSFTIQETDLANGQFTLYLDSSASCLPVNYDSNKTSFVFDVTIAYPGGSIKKPLYGYLIVQRRVT